MAPDRLQTLQTLLTRHKGVDLHAATARRVMQDRLTGGDRLADLRRCEFHVFGGPLAAAAAGSAAGAPALATLLATGRYYNPNKHRYGHFAGDCSFTWSEGAGGALPDGWPGPALATDAGAAGPGLLDELLGGAAPAGHLAVDVAAWTRGQTGAVISGVLWRLVMRGDDATARAAGLGLAVARGGREGLLVNPHMDCWLVAAGAAGD
jgi:hypothetical protein